ncbi:unnamed protein product [Urochloa decumbens]|uniref:NB-ARC domain-containing protein n=1 Tax=Urochloa decumbens TaxID=240449 RepID=A0ABC8Y8D6_9POAL
MERLSNTALSDLVGRSVSFLFAKYDDNQKTATVDQDLRRLRQLLMRSGTIVEEADRRLVTNGAMLRQLKDMKDQMLRGYYVLDVVACRAALGGDGRKDGDDEASHRAFSMSIFNPAKRVRSPSGDPGFRAVAAFGAIRGVSSRELQEKVQSLEAMIGDAKEFVVFLTNCPPLYRQPYSAHLFMERCMFGRYMEKDRVMDFLLQVEPPGAPSPGVLPIVGPAHIGKSTLVEHVCNDERVRNHFSLISFYSQSSLEGEVLANLEANCLIKHQNGNAPRERQLVVIELLEDVNEETWNMMLSSESSISHGSSRIIVTSRSENIVKLGTTHALRLQCLTTEAYWYFFKMAAFGSNDPGEHPKLASLALEMASLMQGSFTFATIGAIVLRENFNTQSWHRAVTRVRDYMQKNVLVNKYHDDVQVTGQPRYSWSIVSQKPSQYFVLRDIYRSDKQNAPDIQFVDLLAGSHQPLGTYEILFWESRIPPYFKYVCKCEIRDM